MTPVDGEIRGVRISKRRPHRPCPKPGLSIVSADSDFARFPELTWINPVAP